MQQTLHVFPPWREFAEFLTPYSTHVLRQATPSSDHPNTLAWYHAGSRGEASFKREGERSRLWKTSTSATLRRRIVKR